MYPYILIFSLDTHEENVDYAATAMTIGRNKNHLRSVMDISTLRFVLNFLISKLTKNIFNPVKIYFYRLIIFMTKDTTMFTKFLNILSLIRTTWIIKFSLFL